MSATDKVMNQEDEAIYTFTSSSQCFHRPVNQSQIYLRSAQKQRLEIVKKTKTRTVVREGMQSMGDRWLKDFSENDLGGNMGIKHGVKQKE